jgi:hypothetical protein
MEVNTKLQELEEEVKVLKAEIRNVLLDIREVILERTNPLDDQGESAFIRMDLRTTASAMAADVAGKEAANAMAAAEAQTSVANDIPEGETPGFEPIVPLKLDPEPDVAALLRPETADSQPEDAVEEAPPPRVIQRDPRELKRLAEERFVEPEVPPMYRADVLPISGNGSISAWLTHALESVGPQELKRIITIHRMWGNLPPNISRALAHIQELLEDTNEDSPAWLTVMQELDRLASL